MPIEIDRSRIIAWQTCPRKRWLEYHCCGKGLQRKAKALPLQVGSAFHAGAECLLQGDIETACYRAIKYLADAFSNRNVEMDGEAVTDESVAYSAQEQMALAEGLIRGWGLERLPEFLQTFEVIEVEREGRAILQPGRQYRLIDSQPANEAQKAEGVESVDYYQSSGYGEELVLMFRPDALVRERLSGDLYVVSWKTASMYGKRSLDQARTDMQSLSEVWGWQENHKQKIEGVYYVFVVKGKRQKDDWNDRFQQNSHLVYGWRKLKPVDEFDDGWAWTFKYPREDGSGNSTLGKGWQRQSVWDNYPGGVKSWIEALHARSIFPRHLDPFDGIFPQSLPVERRRDEVESWKRQVVAQELKIQQSLQDFSGLTSETISTHPEYLDGNFPQYSHSCHSYSGCQFIDICWNGVPAEPGELYQIRQANHPETGEEED